MSLSHAVKKAVPGTTSEALDYPARMPYQNSMANGTVAMKKAIAAHTAKCPESKIVLSGYSQGGAVILDALCGGGGHAEIGPPTPGISKEEGKNIKAVVSFGEPRFVVNMKYNAGTNKKTNGVSSECCTLTCADRRQLYARNPKDAECPLFANVIKSWCDTGDIRCASGDSWEIHSQYLERYQRDAVEYIVSRVET